MTGRRPSSLGILILIALPTLIAFPAGAQVIAPAGRTLFNRAVMVRSFLRLENFDEPAPGQELRRWINPYAVIWGTTPRLSLSFVSPLVRVESRGLQGTSRSSDTTGTGDSTVFARYDWLHHDVPRGSTRLSPEIGLRLPTGGAFGDGSTDVITTLVFSHVRDPHWIVSDVQFTWNRRGDGDRRAGNQWRFDAAYLFRLLPRKGLAQHGLFTVVELNGEHRRKSRRQGRAERNTGGDLLFLSPGIEWFASRRLVLELSVPIPVHRDLNGSQPEPATAVVAGLRWLF
ncbi:MAG: hypothetical protein ACE5HD_05830 [Acidobacteriota bacterium]